MGVPISIRLDDDVRDELEAQARLRGDRFGDLATRPRDSGRAALRGRAGPASREASAAIDAHVTTSPEGQWPSTKEWGTPDADAD